jgi:hypothetical protein
MADAVQRDPRVAIVVVTWNGAETSRRCLRSLASLEYQRYEVCLLDNGSEAGFGAQMAAEFPHVDVVSMRENHGFSAACNGGIAWARARDADYVLLINDDTTADPGMLRALVDRAEAYGRRAIVAPLIMSGERVWSAGGYIRQPWFKADHYETPNEAREAEWASGCALLAPLSLVDTVGPMDERYFLYLEDVDWCLRARERGFSVVIEPEARLQHEVSATTGRLESRIVRYYTYRNYYLLAFTHSGLLGKLFFAAHFAITLAKIGCRSVMPGYRRSSWYHARTRALADFLRRRWGKAPYGDETSAPPATVGEKVAV